MKRKGNLIIGCACLLTVACSAPVTATNETVANTSVTSVSGVLMGSVADVSAAVSAKVDEVVEAATKTVETVATETTTAEADVSDTAAAETTTSDSDATEESATETATSTWDGPVLNAYNGTVMGPSGKETYYNLDMSGIVEIMRGMGNTDEYWVREDGVKMLGDYIMCAANLSVHPRGSLVESSLGMCIVCDTGGFAAYNPNQLDIAVTW